MERVADFKVKYANVIGKLMPDDEKKIMLEQNVVNVLVDRDQDGRRILLAHEGGRWDLSKLNQFLFITLNLTKEHVDKLLFDF